MEKYAIGIDLGGTKVLAGIVNICTGEVIYSLKKKTKKEKGNDALIKKIVKIIEELINNSGIPLNSIMSIGLGLAGQVDRGHGILISSPNINCNNIDFKNILEEKFSKPVFVGNDVEVATIGELTFGQGANYNNFVCIFVGTGVGSGIVINKKLYTGFSGTAGEIGHITVDFGGRRCGCGANGCLEAYASRTAIEQKIQGAIKQGQKSVIADFIKDDGIIRSKHLKAAIEMQDELVMNCVAEAAEYLSSGLASIINFLNPETIILGGGLVGAIDLFFDLTKKKTVAKCLPTPAINTKIEKAKLGDFAGIIGAALLESYRGKHD